jgi:hypothetical protein
VLLGLLQPLQSFAIIAALNAGTSNMQIGTTLIDFSAGTEVVHFAKTITVHCK